MGLDMYLEARRALFPRDPSYDELNALDIIPEVSDNLNYFTVTREVAYWRKANQIHAWFVKHVQGGEDNCEPHYVTSEQLTTLRDLCIDLLKSRSEVDARVQLPPAEGFFFGGYEIDDWYWRDLENTVEQLSAILNEPRFEICDFYYRSSW